MVFNDYIGENEDRAPIYLTAIDIIDIDGDGILEIFIDLYGYEQGGHVAIYKYMKNKVYGETNYRTSMLP